MRKTVQITVLVIIGLVFITGCGFQENKQQEVKPKKLVVLLYDISKSNDKYAILLESHLKKLFARIAFDGGGKFYSYLIQSNSIEQEGFEYIIPSFDTLQLMGNPYQIKNRAKKNAETLKHYKESVSQFITVSKKELLKHKNEQFTDLQNAIQLAKVTLNQSIYKDWSKTLIIISDCKNDLPPTDGEDKMKPVDLTSKVVLVRPTRTEYITGTPLIITNSINDALKNL